MPRLQWMIVAVSAFLMGACGGGTPSAEDITIDITYPPENTVIYAETLTIEGTMNGADAHRVTVALVDPEGASVADVSVNTSETWRLEIPHGHTDAPTEFTIRVITETENETFEHLTRTVIIADHSFRPDGVIANIVFPTAEDPIGGTEIPIEGTASGIPDNTFTLRLVGADNSTIDETTVTMINPYFVDEVRWQTTLSTNDYTGQATLQLLFEDNDELTAFAEVAVFIGEAAG